MKKAVIFVVLTMVVIGYCAAQNANDAQRIVGTWTDQQNQTWVFNANGTGTFGGNNFNYGISANGNIYLTNTGSKDSPMGDNNYVLYMSPDGKRMFIGNSMFQKK